MAIKRVKIEVTSKKKLKKFGKLHFLSIFAVSNGSIAQLV